jgi:hypothetical protein
LGLKFKTPLLAEIELIVLSSLVHSPKLLVLVDHFEKSSILVGPWQAAKTWVLNAATRPIREEVCIIKF